MKIVEKNGLRILSSNFGYLLHNKITDSYSSIVYLGKFASSDNYEEVKDNNIDSRLIEKISDIENENTNQNNLIDTTILAIDEMQQQVVNISQNNEDFINMFIDIINEE